MRAAIVIVFVALASCSSPCVQAKDAGLGGLTVNDGATTYGYGLFHWGHNNDCGPSSITIDGTQQIPQTTTPFHLAFCLPDPGSPGDVTLKIDQAHVFDFSATGTDGNVMFTSDAATLATPAQIAFHGLCTDTRATTFTISPSGSMPGKETPPGGPITDVTLQLAGTTTVWGE